MLLEPHFSMALLLMTNRCNIACQHCYVASSPHGAFGLERRTLLRLVDEIYARLGRVRLALSGGEPLARPDDALATLTYGSGRLPLLLLTNGMLITSRVAQQLASLEDITVRVSLDGPDAETHDTMRGAGSFARLMRGIATLLDAGFPAHRLEAFATIPSRSVNVIDAILALASSVGIGRVKIEPVAKTGRAIETWPRLPNKVPDQDTASYRRKIGSMIGDGATQFWSVREIQDTRFEVLNIYSDGSVYPFTYQDDEDRCSGWLGNIYDRSLQAILERERVSDAVMGKSIRMLRGPTRSLRAVLAERIIAIS